jgi:hypothetical protein
MSSTIEHARADCRGHRFLDQAHPARTGAFGRLLDRAALDLRRAVRHAHEHARARADEAIAVHLLDEVLQHLLGDGEIGDHAVLQRPDGGDVARRAAEHVLRLGADGLDSLAAARRLLANRDHGRLVQHDALAADVDQRIGRAKVDRKIVGKIAPEFLEHLDRGSRGGGTRSGCAVSAQFNHCQDFQQGEVYDLRLFFVFERAFPA